MHFLGKCVGKLQLVISPALEVACALKELRIGIDEAIGPCGELCGSEAFGIVNGNVLVRDGNRSAEAAVSSGGNGCGGYRICFLILCRRSDQGYDFALHYRVVEVMEVIADLLRKAELIVTALSDKVRCTGKELGIGSDDAVRPAGHVIGSEPVSREIDGDELIGNRRLSLKTVRTVAYAADLRGGGNRICGRSLGKVVGNLGADDRDDSLMVEIVDL